MCEIDSNYTINTGINLPLFLSIKLNFELYGGGDLFDLEIPELREFHVNFSKFVEELNTQDGYVRDIVRNAEQLIIKDRAYSKPPIGWDADVVKEYGPVISCFIFTAISLCISFYLLYRLHGLFTLLLGFRSALGQNLTLTKWGSDSMLDDLEATLHNLSILADPDPSPVNSTLNEQDVSFTSNLAIGFYVLLSTVILILFCKMVKCIHRARTTRYHIMGPAGTKVFLKIKFQDAVFAFEICPILHPISSITFPLAPRIQGIRPPRFTCRRIEVSWERFGILEYVSSGRLMKIALPKSLKVPRSCAGEVRHAINTGAFEAAVMMADAHGNTMSLLSDAMMPRNGRDV